MTPKKKKQLFEKEKEIEEELEMLSTPEDIDLDENFEEENDTENE